MIRVLVLIAVTGFLVSVVTLSSAIAIGGPEILTDSALNRWGDFGGLHWSWNGRDGWDDDDGHDSGPKGSREIAWTGGDTLDIDVPADVTYTQSSGPAKLTVTGSQEAVEGLVLEGGELRYEGRRHRYHHGRVSIVMTAPGVTQFNIRGSDTLAIADYKQDKLGVDLSGDASVSAKGEARSVAISVSGSGETDLSDLKVSDADVSIRGSGRATLAPTGAANVDISGSGDVTLLTRPAKLESNVSGSGSIHQKDGADAPVPPVPPEPAHRKAKRT
ncbi:DUF2807 domain-containing protein [Phenylobacterium sp.]|uniref:GIN domain-containing protein n=1 Tax=Phenylobacterium sp. TaxID=1871053 RepID=UPI001229E8F4|nr:DUF2807 domain-containing protein [Phenylobacterium sp.]THD62953.1 MAG: DUF2807 domain-containing protein [Phenylobacterium sp.]